MTENVDVPVAGTVLLIVCLALLAGCFSFSEEASKTEPNRDAIEIPPPGNTRYVYEAQEGTGTLVVEPNETVKRLGPDGSQHQVARLSLSYESGQGDDKFNFEESFNLSSGLLVQQIAWCGSREGGPGEWSCRDDRADVIPGAAGLPGGLGAAPFWNRTLAAEEATVDVRPTLDETRELAYHVDEAASWYDDGCRELRPSGAEELRVRALGFTGGLGPLVLCDGLGLPAAFTVLSPKWTNGERFELVDHEGVWHEWDEPSEGAQGRAVPLRDVSPPLLVQHSNVSTNLTVREAHDAAIEQSDPYRRAMNEEGWLVNTDLSQTGRSSGLTSERATYERSLTAVTSEKERVAVTVEKESESRVHGEDETTYEVTEEDTDTWTEVAPHEAGYVWTQAAVGPTLGLAEALTGQPRDSIGFGLWSKLPILSWQDTSEAVRPDGYTVVSWHEDPWAGERRDGVRIEVPLQVVVDGPTGQILWFETPRDRVPVHPQAG
jgi:hypothetical protein